MLMPTLSPASRHCSDRKLRTAPTDEPFDVRSNESRKGYLADGPGYPSGRSPGLRRH
jgi:hypothetical protein